MNDWRLTQLSITGFSKLSVSTPFFEAHDFTRTITVYVIIFFPCIIDAGLNCIQLSFAIRERDK
jgi:hypothetical protein